MAQRRLPVVAVHKFLYHRWLGLARLWTGRSVEGLRLEHSFVMFELAGFVEILVPHDRLGSFRIT